MSLQESIPLAPAIETGGSQLPRGEENFPRLFGRVAKVVWPEKTAFVLAEIGDASDRAAKDWLSGKVPPPGVVLVALMAEIVSRKR